MDNHHGEAPQQYAVAMTDRVLENDTMAVMKNDLLHTDHASTLKAALSWLAAFLGIGTFLGLVNISFSLVRWKGAA